MLVRTAFCCRWSNLLPAAAQLKLYRHHSTVDVDDVQRLSNFAADWWNPNGPVSPLHTLNEIRFGIDVFWDYPCFCESILISSALNPLHKYSQYQNVTTFIHIFSEFHSYETVFWRQIVLIRPILIHPDHCRM